MAEIYYTSIKQDEAGNTWFYINGSTGYNLSSGWTEETAKEDYLSEEGTMQRMIDEMTAWGFYD